MKIWWLYIWENIGNHMRTWWFDWSKCDQAWNSDSVIIICLCLQSRALCHNSSRKEWTSDSYIYIYNRFQILKRPRKQSLTRYGVWGGRVKWWFQERLRNHYLLIRSLGFKLVFRAPLWAWGRASMYSDPLGGHLKEHLTTERGGFPWISEFSCSGRAERLSLAQCTQRYQFYIPQ